MDNDKENIINKDNTLSEIKSDDFEQDDNDDNDIIPEEVKEVLKRVPSSERKTIEKIMIQSSFGMMGQVNQETSISKKITSEHITQYLDGARENMKNVFHERRENKIFIFGLVVVALIFFVILVCLLKSNPELLEKIIYAVIGLVAGAFGGYGVGRHKRTDDDND